MSTKHLVKATNIIGLSSFILLIYWIFVFILVQVFNLKIFRQHMTEIFALSIFGIIALMVGTLMLNIMLNLTRIAERDQIQESKRNMKKISLLLLAVFPLLAGFLFAGNYFSLHKKEQLLIQSAQAIVQQYPKQTDFIAHYQFTPDYVRQTSDHLHFMSKLNPSIRSVTVLAPDEIDEKSVYLGFEEDAWALRVLTDTRANSKEEHPSEEIILDKSRFIYGLNNIERQYLDQVFKHNLTAPKLIQENNNYRLYYPHQLNGKTVIVFLLSDYYPYGKLGS